MKRALAAGMLPLALVVAACTESGGARPQRRPLQFPVDVQTVEARPVEYAVTALGTIDVFERVQITARVAGVVDAVKFREGDVVKQGQVLVAIDAARYLLGERQATAALDRAKVAVADAEAGLARRETAETGHPGLIPGEELETYRTKLATAKADLAERTVDRDRAALDDRDAQVRAPIAGEIESRTIETGGYVQPGTVLATMVRREPLLVRFDVPEGDAGRLAKGQALRLAVNGDARTYHAAIEHVAAIADTSSRMVQVTAVIDDPQRAGLHAGGFAQITVPIGDEAPHPVIPESAIRPSERGFLAYVVDGETAHERVLELGLRTPDGLVEVKHGLAPGDQLVVRGGEALRDGATVKIGGTRPGGRPDQKPAP